MAEASPTNVSEIPVTLDKLASQSKLYKAIVEFHGTDSLDVLTYPINSNFSEQCFTAVVKCLGNVSKFSEILQGCPLAELFHISLYLGSDSLLYYTVFDLLNKSDPEWRLLFLHSISQKLYSIIGCLNPDIKRYGIILLMDSLVKFLKNWTRFLDI